jgi:hypothetical protein
MVNNLRNKIATYRFELLLFGLLMVIFDKVFFTDDAFYISYVWPVNMLVLGVVSMGVFHGVKNWLNTLKNALFLFIICIPIFADLIFSFDFIGLLGVLVYLAFYLIIFVEVMRQITARSMVTTSVIYGSLSGFLLLVFLSTFSFILLNYLNGPVLKGITGKTVPELYQQFTYFSIITNTTIGYGDITPITDNARLLAAFWGVVSQFYMIALVGIIISKFSGNSSR